MTYTLELLRAESTTVAVRVLDDGRILAIHRLIVPGSCALTITRPEDLELGVRSDYWEYADPPDGPAGGLAPAPAAHRALAALERWDGNGEPTGWTRHPATGRRRPDGDPDREHVRQ
jgi:hypothetical protein